MSIIRTGSAHVSCRAFLDNSHSLSGRQNAVFFDGFITPLEQDEAHPHVTCSFRYLKRTPSEILEDGFYDIFAKVTTRFLLCLEIVRPFLAGCSIPTWWSPREHFQTSPRIRTDG